MIEIATAFILFSSTLTPFTSQPISQTDKDVPRESKNRIEEAISPDYPLTSLSVEAYVRDYFREEPILAEIARCESTFRQFDKDGNVLKGELNRGDIGIMQINRYYHEEDAEKLGFDIYTINGNLGYAKWLYAKYGEAPWTYSSKCWNKYREIAKI